MGLEVWKHYMDERTDLNKDDTFALLCLANWADDKTGECYPGIEAIATKLRAKPRSARATIKRLEKNGELLVVRDNGMKTQGGRTSLYILISYRQKIGVPIPAKLRQVAHERKEFYAKNGAKGGAKGCSQQHPEGVQSTTPLEAEGVQSSAPLLEPKEAQRGAVERQKGVQSTAPKPPIEPPVLLGDKTLSPRERETAAQKVLDLLRSKYKAQPLGYISQRRDFEMKLDEHVDVVEIYGWDVYEAAFNRVVKFKDGRWASNIQAQIVMDEERKNESTNKQPAAVSGEVNIPW